MPSFSDFPIRSRDDIRRFEEEKPFNERVGARSIYDVFVESARRDPTATAITMVMTGAHDETARYVSYRELLGDISRAANLFTEIGGPQPGVAYLLPILVETQVTLWGAETAGYAVPINFVLQPEHIADLVRSSGASILVALGPHPILDIWQKAVAVAELLPEITLVQVYPSEQVPDGVVDFGAALAEQPGDRLTFGRARRDEEVAAYFHTGGTTAAPKLVAHTHRNQIVSAFGGAVLLDYTESDVLVHGLALFHVAATIVGGLSLFMAGGHLVLLSPAGMHNPAMLTNYWRVVERYGATVIGSVPAVLGALLDIPVDADISTVRLAVTGSASLPTSVVERFQELTGTTIHEVLGMTETAGLVAIAPAHVTPVVGSVGLPLPYTSVVVRQLGADGSLGEECAANEIGVLTVSGPTVTPGYRNPDDSDELLRSGIVNSGDLAYADEEGRLFIAGRAEDLIIRSGHNIDPLMIESIFQSHPAVELAAAVGQPDRYAGELPVCYVLLRAGAQATDEELRQFAEPLIAERAAWPKQIYLVDTVPVTGVGKVFKPQLRTDAVERLVRGEIAAVVGSDSISVGVVPGGKRGMDVTVILSPDDAESLPAVEQALDGYPFNYDVTTSIE